MCHAMTANITVKRCHGKGTVMIPNHLSLQGYTYGAWGLTQYRTQSWQ